MLPAIPYLPSNPITIFISYAQEDKTWYGKLEKHLAYERLRGTVISISRKKAPPGILYSAFIAEQIDAAQIILLLVSPNFMASEECMAEMEQALQRSQDGSVRLIPIMLDAIAAIDWEETDLGQLRPLPEDGRSIKSTSVPDTTLANVAESIISVVKTMQRNPQWEHPLSYRSLSGIPPLVHQTRRVQRPQLVQQIYHTLTEPDISALVLVGMGALVNPC
jgi:TIR domain